MMMDVEGDLKAFEYEGPVWFDTCESAIKFAKRLKATCIRYHDVI